jgi:DNA-binding NarL/FixJ family response regulator
MGNVPIDNNIYAYIIIMYYILPLGEISMLPTSLLIIDPNLYFSRAAAKYLLKFQEVEKVDLATDLDEACLTISASKPDALLVDYEYYTSDAGVAALCKKMKQQFPDTLIIALTLYTLEPYYDLLPASDDVSGIISKQDFAEGVIALFELPLTS